MAAMASKDEAWTKLLERSFSSPRRGLVGPRAWKAADRRQKAPLSQGLQGLLVLRVFGLDSLNC